jgi:predicted esterase YcpF (UPF0227 family)
MPPRRLIYLHGFRSSPQSTKARWMARWMADHQPDVDFVCPQLPASPRDAIALAEAQLGPGTALIGSSLGGFYATVLAERHGVPAVLLNPAVDPARDLAALVGPLTAYHDPTLAFHFTAAHVDELRAMTPAAISRPERYAAVIAKGDELLDWREMSARYAGATTLLLEGSDHGLSDFEQHLPFVLRFLQLHP